MRRALVCLALLACTDHRTVAPVVDSPSSGSRADPYPDLDEIVLSVAHAGAADAVVAASFRRGQALSVDAPLAKDLVVHMSGRAGGVEVAYGRTCTSDLSDPALAAPHLYFSRIVKWSDGPQPGEARRTGGLSYAAADGSAVLVAGTAAGQPVTSAERFDARTGLFAPLTAPADRSGAVLVPLGDHRALILGGVAAGQPADFFELYDPLAAGARQVERTQDARLQLVDPVATTLSDGSAIVIGARVPDPVTQVLGVSGVVWSIRLGDGGAVDRPRQVSTLAIPRVDHTLTRLGDDLGAAVLVVGGRDAADAPVASAELYKPLSEAFADPATFHPALLTPRSRHSAVLVSDGSVLILGGIDASGTGVATMELYSPEGRFSAAGSLPLDAGLLDVSVTGLPDGRVLIAGGRRTATGPALDTAFIARLDPLDGVVDVVSTDKLARPRAGHSAVLLCDGTVLLVGGSDDPAGHGSERYQPPSLGRR